MDFDDYQDATAATAIYPGAGTGSMAALAYLESGLGEAGEIQGKLKKILRDDSGEITAEKRNELAKELGDLQWYVARLSDELGLALGAIARGNLDKLASRKDRGVLQGSGDSR
ncbi:MazG-like nucleotide pyrophosphohydrolase [Gordonia Phage PhinkBoden]|nr:MazG-like nucleotide pyrophosphohydrolase [Gordonia Phage PhinkBoden]